MCFKIRKFILINRFLVIFILLLLYPGLSNQLTEDEVKELIESDEISLWANTFGQELWSLGQKMTKSQEIKEKYKNYNARVEKKNGTSLIASIVENVGRMLASKMDAVKCILELAEEVSENFKFNDSVAENFTYYSSKYSNVTGEEPRPMTESVDENKWMYREMSFNADSHFFNISVNTGHSSVHVPTNVYDRSDPALEAIQWSEDLDEVFTQNYKSDPALSWQYFCSETGIFRHYPAMRWHESEVDVFDCRRRSWYIEAATCSKDVVILIDNSGSMTGFRNYLAKLTVKKIMDTFSNNDFLNIYNYSAGINELVPCYKDMLVQATPENINVFNDAMKILDPEGYANVSRAFETAFQLLEKYRDLRKCNESVQGCNQAIMLITDGVAGNITEIFEKYNWIDTGNKTKIPVRVFTYLLGQEVTKVREIQWMACLNRGYYSHIKTMDEVSEDVLEYVNVIATPLVLQGIEHPPTWTHAFADQTHVKEDDENEGDLRLMIAVGVPAFDRKVNKQNDTKTANLLGVAGTDVPVEDIDKLTLPYKLGVNGYSFVISNNGYVLLHPDLRPLFAGRVKENYNSVDFSEVEQLDDTSLPRQTPKALKELRDKIIFATGVEQELNVSVKFHYDNMRRVSKEMQDFYFAPLPNTPFTLGLVLPSTYGKTWIKVGDEIKRNQHMGINITDFFVGQNWKVHPDWVYCKYHYLEGHEFKNPEEELLHFLTKLNDTNFEWHEQYEQPKQRDPDSYFTTDGRSDSFCIQRQFETGLDHDAYYCNKELFQLLVFDAKVTNTSYREWKFENIEEEEIINRYNASIRFVSTMSGLTRWQFIYGEEEVDTDQEFGDYHKKAIDETWYKSAVLQHFLDPDSFVYSVPHTNDVPEEGELKVTASLAIVPRDGGEKTPSCVVGFQFLHTLMYDRFLNITSKTKCDNCTETCDSYEKDCYVIDNNGYVILSENRNHTGKFFGEIDGAVMQEMTWAGIFNNITVYDLQGWCDKTEEVKNPAGRLINPFKLAVTFVNWLFVEFVIYVSRFSLWIEGVPWDDEGGLDFNYDEVKRIEPPRVKPSRNQDEDDYYNRPKETKYETTYFSCDLSTNLYVLNQTMFIRGSGIKGAGPRNCSRPYYVKRIPHSNLLLVVINAMYQSCYYQVSSKPERLEYEEEFPCYKLDINYLNRRRLEECYTEHPEEAEVQRCGRSSIIELNLHGLFLSFLVIKLYRYIIL